MFGGNSLFGTQGASQTFGLGFGASQQAGAAEVAGKKARQEEKQTCLPVTIAGIETALSQRSDDGELRFFGIEPGMLVLVAAVEVVVKQPASLEMVLNDATGRIKVRHYLTEAQPGEFDGIIAGKYVSVFGNVRTAPELHLAAVGVRLVQSADEVSYHMIESVHAALRLQKGAPISSMTSPKKMPGASMDLSPPKGSDLMGASPAADISMPSVTATSSPTVVSSVRLEGAALRTAIIAFIKKEEVGRQEGVAFQAICHYTEPSPTAEVRSVLDALIEEGEAITTIDEDHFSCQI